MKSEVLATTMQRFAITILSVIISLSFLTACARDRTDDGVVRLRFWHAWGGHEGKALNDLVDEFNRTHPGIIVEPSQFTIGDKLLASIAGGKPPDIATVWSYMLTPMGESGAFLPLDDYMTSSGYTADDYLPNVWEYGLYGDQRWGVPTTLNVTAIFYIRHLVEQAGLDPSIPPRTTAELEEWAKQLLRKDAAGNVMTLGFVPTQPDVWMRAFGGEIFDSEKQRFVFDQPENIAAMEWMKELVNVAGGMSQYRRFTAQFGKLESPSNPLFMDKLAMKEDGQWVIKFFETFAPDIEYGIIPYPPSVAGGPEVAKLDGSFWAIPVGTKHPEEAWQFLSWLIAPEQNARLCAAWSNVPPMRATLDVPVLAEARKNAKFEQFIQLLAQGKAIPQPATPVSEQLFDKLDSGMQRVFSGAISSEAMLKELDQDLNAELERSESLLGSDVDE